MLRRSLDLSAAEHHFASFYPRFNLREFYLEILNPS